jgi:cytochrome c oxidase subunit 2
VTPAAPGTITVRVRPALAVLIGAALLLAGGLAWRGGLLDGLTGQAPLKVRAVGHSWWWEFDYPDLGIKTANELHLPENRQVELTTTSVDVLHTLSIPELGVQVAGPPAATTTTRFETTAAGEFGGECSQICGLAHNMMRVKAVVQSTEWFDAWVVGQQKPAAVPESEAEWRGYEMLTTACAKCHSLDPGEKRTDLAGPNLAHLMSRSVFAGATFELNGSNLRRWIRDTQTMKAGNDMRVNLPRDDFDGVMQYLLILR